LAKSSKHVNENVEQFILKNDSKVNVIGEGRLVNLVAAEGHPSEVMDMSFANQFLSVLNLVNNKGKFENKIYEIDRDQDLLIAGLKLEAMGIRIDKLSEVQNKYLSEYGEGT